MWTKWWGLSRIRQNQTIRSPPPSLPPPSLQSPSRSRSNNFSYYSFKDIDILLESELESSKSPYLFHNFSMSPSIIRSFSNNTRTVPTTSYSIICSPYFDHNTIVFYFTTLRVIRRTYEDCRVVHSILQGLGVAIDERDVSIDDRFRDELREILGRWNVILPCVFIGGKYIGGADDVKRLYDNGELQGLIERLPKSKLNGCDLCGGVRFIVCDVCDGNHKVFTEKSGFRIKSCTTCNANGLIRCPTCFFVFPRHTK